MKSVKILLFYLVVLSVYTVDAQNTAKPILLDTTYNVPREYRKIHKKYPEAVPAKDNLPANVISEQDIIYTTLKETPYGDRDLHLDLFRPDNSDKLPALIMVHGGGWRAGNKSLQTPMAQMIAARGFVTVAIEYQLSLEAPYPASVYNIKAAVRWAKANGEKYGIDTSKIAISGCSAGGHLASLVATTNGVERFEGDHGYANFSSTVHACIDIDGVINFLAPLSLNKERDSNSADVAWLGGTFYEIPHVWKEASPIYWVNEHTVPFLFLNSGYPRFHAGQAEMIDLMNEYNRYTEVHKFDVKVHPFWLFHPWVETTIEYIVEFLDDQFIN